MPKSRKDRYETLLVDRKAMVVESKVDGSMEQRNTDAKAPAILMARPFSSGINLEFNQKFSTEKLFDTPIKI